MKQISLKGLRKKAWDLQSRVIRQLERGKCFTCPDQRHWKEQNLGHCEHGDSLDFDHYNGVWTNPRWLHCQCVRCNKYNNGESVKYANKLVKEFGDEILDIMLKQKHEVRKFTREELEQIIAEFTALKENEKLE